jgi:hypothetical protein
MRYASSCLLIALAVAWVSTARPAGQAGAPQPTSPTATGPFGTPRVVLTGPIRRTPDGKPDLRGHWNSAPLFNSNVLEEHPAGFGIQAGKSVVVDPPDGIIPYQPWALAQRNENRKSENAYLDNEGRCHLSGVPRIMLFSFQIDYAASDILLLFEYAHATRVVHMDRQTHLPAWYRSFMGDSIGRWEGDTLVVNTANFNGKFWLALGGDFFSEAATIVERFSLSDPNTLGYEATITDPKVFTRPWTWRWNRPYVRGTVVEIPENHCHEGNTDIAVLKNTYDASRKAGGTVTDAAPRRNMPAGEGPLSGRWIYDVDASGRSTGDTALPSELRIARTATELHFLGTTERQAPTEAVYKLDGSEVPVTVGPGITATGRARVQGDTVVLTNRRSFKSPLGDEVVIELSDTYSVKGDLLTVQRTQTIGDDTVSAKAVYNRVR